MELRDYQKKVVRQLYERIRAGNRRILVFAPPGSGKTIMASQIVAHAVQRGRRVLFLVQQTAEKFERFGLECGYIKGGLRENREALAQIASVQTLGNRQWWRDLSVDVVVLDECHITAFASEVRELMRSLFPQAIYVGLTATPWRLGRENLGDVFEEVVQAPTPREMQKMGHIVKFSYYGVERANLEAVGTVDGDFDERDLALACDRPELVEQAVSKWQALAAGRRTIVFATSVAHSQHLCEAFQHEGIAAEHVDGSTPKRERERIYQRLADGETQVLTSCSTLTEGFDVPAVSCVLLCRPTQSRSLYFQMLGRGSRPCPETDKRDCLAIDQGGNVERHRMLEELDRIELHPGQEKKGNDGPPLKPCPPEQGGCGAWLYAFRKRCPNCGFQLKPAKKYAIAPGLERFLSEGDLERLQEYQQQLRQAYQSGYAPSWAAYKFRDRHGHWPPFDWARGAILGEAPSVEGKRQYRQYLEKVATRKEKGADWIAFFERLELGAPQRSLVDF
jgi:superfamily II DNA or RNA helicase